VARRRVPRRDRARLRRSRRLRSTGVVVLRRLPRRPRRGPAAVNIATWWDTAPYARRSWAAGGSAVRRPARTDAVARSRRDGRRRVRRVDRADLRPRDLAETTRWWPCRGVGGGGWVVRRVTSEGRKSTSFRCGSTRRSDRTAGRLPVHVSHLKCESSLVWGGLPICWRDSPRPRTRPAISTVRGMNSSLASLLPPGAPVGGLERLVRDVAARDRLQEAVEQGEPDFQSSFRSGGTHRGGRDRRRPMAGDGRGVDRRRDGFDRSPRAVRLLIEDPDTSCIGHANARRRRARDLADPRSSRLRRTGRRAHRPRRGAAVHPREYGTSLGRSRSLATSAAALEAVIRKMTSLPAGAVQTTGTRGGLTRGGVARTWSCSIRPASATSATFGSPHRVPAGDLARGS